MSLIEQAAKRLEQLKRAGVAGGEAERGEQAVREALPEAVMRAAEARRQSAPAAPAAPVATPAAPPDAVPGTPPPARRETQPKHGPRSVTIDLDRLGARGFVTPTMPTSQIADEFRVIKRPIIRNALTGTGGAARHRNLVMVTSALPGEGKTFTSLNLAISIAMEYDHTALLVDGDVAHPALPRLLGVPETPGLMDLLSDESMDVADALVKTNIDKLSILPAGSVNRRATELMASEQMTSLLAELASRYPDRIIVFDSPPLLHTTESRVLANHMGQVVVVVAAQSTSQGTLNHALATIESCDVVMMLLNKASRAEVGSYSYYLGNGDA